MNCGFFFYQSVTWRDVVSIPLLFVNHIDFNWSFMTLFITEMSRWTIWWKFKVRGRKDPVLQIQKIYLSQPLLKINVTILILILSFLFRRLCDGDLLISSLVWHPCCCKPQHIQGIEVWRLWSVIISLLYSNNILQFFVHATLVGNMVAPDV